MNTLKYFKPLQRHLISSIRFPAAEYSTHHIKYMEIQDRWREKDGLSKRWKLIYKSPMDLTLNYLTTFLTVSTGAVTAGGVYYIANFDMADIDKPLLLGGDVVIANTPVEALIYLGAYIFFHASLKILLSRFVIRMYQDGDNYMAVFKGHMYNKIKLHEFHLKDFKRLNPPWVVSWGDGRFSLGNKHAIILENYFKTPEHFNYLLYKKKIDNDDD
ncbi:uncharacterized protein LOC105398607 [Plutella xylostella]|uniref:uncharacterized protein LOC105398607 n=1 Tax=Plutella xylostella TaxID=51655 RepID=UPI0020321B67|nr:uncharacterized protein LOC105398607 [Plutella xylostella]